MAREGPNRMAPPSADGGELALVPLTAEREKAPRITGMANQESFEARTEDDGKDIFDVSAWEHGDDVLAYPRSRMPLHDAEDDSLAEASDDEGYAVDADAGGDIHGALDDLSYHREDFAGWIICEEQNRMAPMSADAGELALVPLTAEREKAPRITGMANQESFEARTEDEEKDIFDFSAWEHGDDVLAQPRSRMPRSYAEDDSMAEASDVEGDVVEADAGVDIHCGLLDDLSLPWSVEGGLALSYAASASGATPATRALESTGLCGVPRLTPHRLLRGGVAPPAHVRGSPAEETHTTPAPAPPTQPRPAWRRPFHQARRIAE